MEPKIRFDKMIEILENDNNYNLENIDGVYYAL